MGRRGTQTQLPGQEDKKDQTLTRLAKQYAEKRDERMRLGEEEKAKKDTLLMKMREKGLTHYKCPETKIEIDVEHEEKLKVRVPKPEQAGKENGKSK